ncbi:MAG TPA: stage II sporulation protein M, partial [Chitinophagaceae bacterium]|nr:stage II sporulation protein M [Chitinophagaceae bacterium]
KDGVKIMVGLMPVFGLAAFFEGFITRLYNDISILTTIITSLSVLFVVWYFIIFPIQLGRRKCIKPVEEEV